jgi:7-keto-8-aminopelargonate synthetase-like enzyme
LALERFQNRDRLFVALSLNKAFAAGGGAVVFPTVAERQHVLTCGGPMVFGGPVQPPMLGAALASARLHLEPSFAALQQELANRIRQMHALANETGVALVRSYPQL